MKKIIFLFTVNSSHGAATPDYSGTESTIFRDDTFLENIDFLGYPIVSATVKQSEGVHEVTVDFARDISIEEATCFVEGFASLATHTLSYNINHHYGSPYIEIDYGTFYCNNGDGMRDHLSMQLQRTASLTILPTGISELHELAHFYFLGMQSNNLKAKFFNLFLIIEAIEGSGIARSMFSDGTLFTEEEKKLIRETADQMENDRKKSVVQSLLSRTDQSRHDKLHSVLKNLGITHFCVLDSTKTPISIETVKLLIEARNKLFHKGNAVDENLIWGRLIPLTREIVKHLLNSPLALAPMIASPT